ncbi:MAG: UvrD-helicase domain-containing protein, partial [Nitrospiria bacterium]
MRPLPLDQEDRDRAVTTFDQNVVVTAGAGTGKTTLLINRLLHLLLREPEALPITQIVALTFTNKSAHEMKTRLKAALEALISTDAGSEKATGFMTRYRLSKNDLDRRAAAALRDFERGEIGTIHHFAASLLRLYPLQ